MKIRVLRNLGRGLPDYKEGQLVTLDGELGRTLCERGLAELVEDDKPAKPAEPKEEAAKPKRRSSKRKDSHDLSGPA